MARCARSWCRRKRRQATDAVFLRQWLAILASHEPPNASARRGRAPDLPRRVGLRRQHGRPGDEQPRHGPVRCDPRQRRSGGRARRCARLPDHARRLAAARRGQRRPAARGGVAERRLLHGVRHGRDAAAGLRRQGLRPRPARRLRGCGLDVRRANAALRGTRTTRGRDGRGRRAPGLCAGDRVGGMDRSAFGRLGGGGGSRPRASDHGPRAGARRDLRQRRPAPLYGRLRDGAAAVGRRQAGGCARPLRADHRDRGRQAPARQGVLRRQLRAPHLRPRAARSAARRGA